MVFVGNYPGSLVGVIFFAVIAAIMFYFFFRSMREFWHSDGSGRPGGARGDMPSWACANPRCRADNPGYGRFCRKCGHARGRE